MKIFFFNLGLVADKNPWNRNLKPRSRNEQGQKPKAKSNRMLLYKRATGCEASRSHNRLKVSEKENAIKTKLN